MITLIRTWHLWRKFRNATKLLHTLMPCLMTGSGRVCLDKTLLPTPASCSQSWARAVPAPLSQSHALFPCHVKVHGMWVSPSLSLALRPGPRPCLCLVSKPRLGLRAHLTPMPCVALQKDRINVPVMVLCESIYQEQMDGRKLRCFIRLPSFCWRKSLDTLVVNSLTAA